ncbi:MAG: Ig-like domain-containing protein [Bacteroidales bacterium]|nr:Ig-like domain-containing protein [Bacteroidales bacterium]
MKRALIFFIYIQISLFSYGQIIADHTVVDRYDDIPQYYIDEVKKMMLVVASESHGLGYMNGLVSLESLYSNYAVNYTSSGTPEGYTTSHLRITRATWGDVENETGWIYSYGEEDWFTSETAITRTKAGLTYCNAVDLTVSVIMFGWCYDGGIFMPYVGMSDYLNATQSYIDYCDGSIQTKVVFTTGTVDSWSASGEEGYNKSLGYQVIRDYVSADESRILFDYADILCYDDGSSEPNTATWDGNTFPIITTTNYLPEGVGHISEVGELRLAKAMWWMLARIAGWDGVTSSVIPVENITVSGAGGSSTISTDGGTLQLTANVSPTNATNKTVTWSISNGTGEATISSSGLVIAVADGTVTARATANDGSGVYGELVISISNQIVPVADIVVSGAGGSSTISTLNGTLQLSVNISPTKATDKTVTWSISSVTGEATISSTGLVTAVSNGTVIARATANDGSGVYGELTITITNQFVAVSGITINIEGGLPTINIPGGTLQLQALINPADASDQSVTWEVINGTGEAEISSGGLLTAISEGTVTVRATANDGSGISTTLEIIIEYITYNQFKVIVHDGLIEVLFNEDHTGYNLSLYDFMGSLRCKEIINGTSFQFNASVLSPGPYYIILSSSVIHEVRKVLLVK